MLRVKLLPVSLNAVRYSSVLGKAPDLQKTNWKQDVVYLYQFKRAPVAPNLSPYCLKVETFLRAHNIKYEPIMSYTIRSKYGKLPFIELNGKQIADSDFILHHLLKHFKINENLTSEQRGIARAVDRMLDQSTVKPLFYFRCMENADNFINPNVSGLPIPGFLAFIARNRYYKSMSHALKVDGVGRMKRDDVITVLRRDLQSLDDILGDKKFLLGVLPTTPDFSMFGQLASTYYLPFRQPVTDLLDDEFPRLRQHIERMRTHYWKKGTETTVSYVQNSVDMRSFQFTVESMHWDPALSDTNGALYKMYAQEIWNRTMGILGGNLTGNNTKKNSISYVKNDIFEDSKGNYQIGKMYVSSLRESDISSGKVLAFVTVLYTAHNSSEIPSVDTEIAKLNADSYFKKPQGKNDSVDFCVLADNELPNGENSTTPGFSTTSTSENPEYSTTSSPNYTRSYFNNICHIYFHESSSNVENYSRSYFNNICHIYFHESSNNIQNYSRSDFNNICHVYFHESSNNVENYSRSDFDTIWDYFRSNFNAICYIYFYESSNNI
ncbi:hypothetical protein FO519_007256 [Halicephalobus sp. NKZ332]|nr:hypothetical protein FO519_007256 [Halicephalobus sp. NKZ332]